MLPRLPLRRSLRLLPSTNALSLGSHRAAGLHPFNFQPTTTMSNIQINLELNHEPFAVEMLVDRIRQQHFKWDAYGQATANRLVLSGSTQVLCLSIDDSLTNRQLKSLGDEFKRRQPRIARLGAPIMAIHYIEAGRGWPHDANSDPVSILNCLPVEQWARMASKPPLITHHPLLNQPADTVVFQCPMSAGMPVMISYDSIATVTQTGKFVRILINAEANHELLWWGVVELMDNTAAAGLAEGLRSRRVKRIRHNELVKSVLLFPKLQQCGGQPQNPVDMRTWTLCSSREQLLHNANKAFPEAIQDAMRKMFGV